jgi:hypothetical protein
MAVACLENYEIMFRGGEQIGRHFPSPSNIHPALYPEGGTIFDDHATEVMGKAFDSARQALHDKGQPQIVYEVIAKRIVDAARKGERDPKQLRRAGLAGLGKADAE